MDRSNALKNAIATVADMYTLEFSELTLRMWLQILEIYEPRDIQAALVAHMSDPKRGMFAPKPADLIAQIERTRAASCDVAHLALQSAVRIATGRVGVAFEDPAIHVAVAMLGGWPVAYSQIANPESAAAYFGAFQKAYAKALDTKTTHPAILLGVAGDPSYQVVGDEDKVNAVVKSGYDPITKFI